MNSRECCINSYHCQLLCNSVGNCFNRACPGSHSNPIVLGFWLGNQTGLQKTGRNRPVNDCLVFACAAKNTTFLPWPSAAWAASHLSQTTTSGGDVDVR